jgi:hypothetical protein
LFFFQFHPHKQKLRCPGCEQPFIRITSLVNHIEKDKCPNISASDVMKERVAKALLGSQLDTVTNFADYLVPHEILATVNKAPHRRDSGPLQDNMMRELDFESTSLVEPKTTPQAVSGSTESRSIGHLSPELAAASSSLSTILGKQSEVAVTPSPQVPSPPKALPPHLRKGITATYWLNRKAEDVVKKRKDEVPDRNVLAEAGKMAEDELKIDDYNLSDDDDNLTALISNLKSLLGPESLASSPEGSVINTSESMRDELSVVDENTESIAIFLESAKNQVTDSFGNVDSKTSNPWAEWTFEQENACSRCDPDSPMFDPRLLYLVHMNEYLCSKCRYVGSSAYIT